jgi:hypothetical protein
MPTVDEAPIWLLVGESGQIGAPAILFGRWASISIPAWTARL